MITIPETIDKPYTDRGKWASKTEFLLSCIGYAVGIGNVWRFPYLCYRNGGGAFLIPYLLMLFLCGIPLFFMEIVIGQFSSRGCLSFFRMVPLLKGTGYAIVVVNLLCTCYYSVIICYPLIFLAKSFTDKLPWISCDNNWNTENCIEITQLGTGNFTNHHSFKTPADEFFHLEILKISNGIDELGSIVWPLFWSLLIVWLIIYVCIIKGIESIGKVVYFTATFPFVILIVLFARGITLPGAIKGIRYYITPDWTRLVDLRVWADAAIQIFFSLGPGWGGIINMASFNHFQNNAKSDSIIIPIVNCSTSIFAGFVVFSVLGFLSHQTGVPVENVATSGPGLAFVTYPEAIAMLPIPQLWSILFFIMLFLLGLDSVFVQIEAIISSVLDEVPSMRRHKAAVVLGACLLTFCMAIVMVTKGGMFILQLLDWYSASISVILICIVEVVMVSWFYGVDNFAEDIYFMMGQRIHICWRIYWKFITPTILILIFFTSIMFNRNITYNDITYPTWSIALGWCSCLLSICCIPGYAVFVAISHPTSSPWLNVCNHHKHHGKWEPANEPHHSKYKALKCQNTGVTQQRKLVEFNQE